MSGIIGRGTKLARGALLSFQLMAAHRLRTLLSISGLSVGVAAVMVMVAVSEGSEQRMLARLQAMGTNLLVVSAAPAPRVAGRPRQAGVDTTLRADDAAAILAESTHAVAAAPVLSRSISLRWEARNVATMLTGTTPQGLRIRNIAAESGRLFDDQDETGRQRVLVLGPAAARSLFPGIDPVGRSLRIGNAQFEVIGVARARGVDATGGDLDDVAFLPFETALRRVFNIPYVHAIFVQAANSAELPMLEDEVRAILGRRHAARSGTAAPFVIQNQARLLMTEREAMQSMNRLVVAAAGVALLLGAVGILTVMLISVRERTREIGLRRAVGATRADIRFQFLSESAMLAAAGGAAGALAGFSASVLAAILGPWDLVLSWPAAGLALACSLVLGVGVGAIPAARAAGLEPIQALRAR